jgi:hypothetical protein
MANKKNKPDWIALYEEYRTGQFSNVVLGKKYGVNESAIRKRAQKESWEKDLIVEVQRRVREKLVRGEGEQKGETRRTPSVRDDEEIVEEASQRGVEVINSHRKDIAKLRTIAQTLLGELEQNQKQSIVVGKGEDKKVIEIELSLKEKSEILRNISQAAAKYIPLERQAFNLNDQFSDPNGGKKVFVYEHFLAALILEKKKIASQKELDGIPR